MKISPPPFGIFWPSIAGRTEVPSIHVPWPVMIGSEVAGWIRVTEGSKRMLAKVVVFATFIALRSEQLFGVPSHGCRLKSALLLTTMGMPVGVDLPAAG